MRVAVHFADDHPLAQDDGPAVVAYGLGRIEDGVHNAPIGHLAVPLDEFLAHLIELAREEYPDGRVVVERLVENEDGSGRWIPASEFDPAQHTAVGPGSQIVRDIGASTSSGAGA